MAIIKHLIFTDMKHLLFILACVAALFTACSDNNKDDDEEELKLEKGTKQEQTLYADENGEDNGIHFSAASDWTATVTEVPIVRNEQPQTVEWITLNMYSGGAGEHTLTMTIRDNLTGKSRKAKITICCGVTEITITIEQQAAKADGTVVKPVKKYSYRETMNSDAIMGFTNTTGDFDKTFSYDTEGRVARIITEYKEMGEGTVTYDFDYRIAGEINITRHCSGYNETSAYRAILDARGNVKTLLEESEGKFVDFMTFKYTDDGRLAQWKDAADYNYAEGNFSYENGLLTKYEYRSEYYDENSITVFPVATAYPNRYPNKGAIDFFGYTMQDDDFDFLFDIGRLGRTSDCLPETAPGTDESPASRADPYLEPNQTIHEVKQYVVWRENSVMNLSYKFDNDKNLTEILMTEPFTVMEAEWDVVVGSELISPQEPGYGYKYEIKNRTERKVRDDRDTYTYTIIY